MAETIDGAPNIAAIPAATPIIKPQETLPVKKPIPTEMIEKAAKALPAFPVMICKALHIVLTKMFELAEVVIVLADCAKASDERAGTRAGTIATKKKDKREVFVKKEEYFFIVF